MKYLKQILVIVFMIALNFAPEAQFYPSRLVNGKEVVIMFSPFADISIVAFWQIWVVKITGILYFVMLCLLLAEYIAGVVKKQEKIKKLFHITKKILIFWIAFRLIFVLCQQSDSYGANKEEVFFDYFVTVYLLQLFLAFTIIINTDKKREINWEGSKNKKTYIFYIFLLWITCLMPYSRSTIYDIEGYIGSRMYTIFRSENIYGETILEFLISGFCMEKLWIMWLVLIVLAGIMNIKRFEQKVSLYMHKILNIITILLLIYTSSFCIFSHWFDPVETFILNPIAAVCLGLGIKLLFMEISETHSCKV